MVSTRRARAWMYARALRRLRRLAPVVSEGRALDVGIGDGVASARLRGRWPRLRFVGVERRDPGRARAALGRDAPLLAADAHELPFRDGAFQIVVFSHVLHHVRDHGRALREARRVLAPGGLLLLAELSGDVLPADGGHGHDHGPGQALAPGLHVHGRLDGAAWEAVLRSAGFEVVAREGMHAPAVVARRPLSA